jgi:hypothetical protein
MGDMDDELPDVGEIMKSMEVGEKRVIMRKTTRHMGTRRGGRIRRIAVKGENVTVVAAAPGFEVLYLADDDNGEWQVVETHPVVAWKITREDKTAEPIVPGDQLSNEYVIRYPNGKINHWSIGVRDSVEACLAAINAGRVAAE